MNIAKPLSPTTPLTPARFYGKYRGVVLQNVDPTMQGRLVAAVPAVRGDSPLPWAMPCVPYVVGTQWSVPPVGSGVWIEFEQGLVELPVWSGCFALPQGFASAA